MYDKSKSYSFVINISPINKRRITMSSGQAIVNPKDVREFSTQLKKYNEEVNNMTSRLNAQFQKLGTTWRDQEHKKFEQEFEKMMKYIKHFEKISNQHIPFLNRKAQKAEDYLSQR
jgi:uncharacterized protein YukE